MLASMSGLQPVVGVLLLPVLECAELRRLEALMEQVSYIVAFKCAKLSGLQHAHAEVGLLQIRSGMLLVSSNLFNCAGSIAAP